MHLDQAQTIDRTIHEARNEIIYCAENGHFNPAQEVDVSVCEQYQVAMGSRIDVHAQQRDASHDGPPSKSDDRVDDAGVDEQQRKTRVFAVVDPGSRCSCLGHAIGPRCARVHLPLARLYMATSMTTAPKFSPFRR